MASNSPTFLLCKFLIYMFSVLKIRGPPPLFLKFVLNDLVFLLSSSPFSFHLLGLSCPHQGYRPGQETRDGCWFLFPFRQQVQTALPLWLTSVLKTRAKRKSCKMRLRGRLEPVGK